MYPCTDVLIKNVTPMPHLNLHITGKVQGVFYRDTTKRKAHEFGVHGFVRNQPDGTVYAEVEGTQEALDALVAWCHKGPDMAAVAGVVVTEGDMVGFEGFEIRR
jgi:acylphosphatase